MLRVYARDLREALQLDDMKLDCLFPQLDSLLELHSHFLSRLRERRAESLQPGSDRNYAIQKLSDILISQVHALNFAPYFLLRTSLHFLFSHSFPKLPSSHFLCYGSCFKHPVVTLLCTTLLCAHMLLLHFNTFCFTRPSPYFLPQTSCQPTFSQHFLLAGATEHWAPKQPDTRTVFPPGHIPTVQHITHPSTVHL